MLHSDDIFDLIDTYGTKTSRWPDEVRREAIDLIDSDPALKSYYDGEKALDDELYRWKEGDGGGTVEDVEDGGDDGDDDDDDDDRDDDAEDGDDEEAELGTESEDGSASDDVSKKPGDDVKGDGSGSDGSTSDGGTAEAAEVDEATEAAFADFDASDMDDAMAEIIGAMASSAYSEGKITDYTRDYDVTERIKAPHSTCIENFEESVNKVSASMQKDLQRIITARSQSIKVPGFRSGRVNPSSLHRLSVNDDRVFRRKQESETKDVAVQLVVDCSGSMGGSKFRIAMQSAWAFAAVLDRLNIQCEVIGFTTRMDQRYGETPAGWTKCPHDLRPKAAEFALTIKKSVGSVRWEALYHPIFKEFGERFTLEQKRRFAHCVDDDGIQLCENIDSVSILEISKRLMQRPEKRKLMIVFSDGSPACSGIDRGLLNSHMREVVQLIEKNGVETIGIGIQDASVKQFYPKHFVVNNLVELPGKIMSELKKFIVS